MPEGLSFNEFRDELERLAPGDVVDRASHVLAEPVDWHSLIRERLRGMLPVDFESGAQRLYQPRNYVLYDSPGKYRIVLNYFDRAEFDKQHATKKIGPHMHHFSFAVRILRGMYYSLLFSNVGTLTSPRLTPDGRGKLIRTNDVYVLPYDRYHCVLAPEDATVTLMVRGPAVVPFELDPGLPVSSEHACLERENIIQVLRSTEPPERGRRVLPNDLLDVDRGEP